MERKEFNEKVWLLLDYELEQLIKPLEAEVASNEPVLE